MQQLTGVGQDGDKLLLNCSKQTLGGIAGVVMIRGNVEPIRIGHLH
ncbi:hypothetical protein VRZ08_01615 [Rhodopseudomonas sp. G2_2311]